jgi:hypothetical protein
MMTSPMCRQVEHRARRLQDMMEGLDVEVLALARHERGHAFYAARTVCIGCIKAELCSEWLAVPPEERARPSFCPNADLLERFARPLQIDSEADRQSPRG